MVLKHIKSEVELLQSELRSENPDLQFLALHAATLADLTALKAERTSKDSLPLARRASGKSPRSCLA